MTPATTADRSPRAPRPPTLPRNGSQLQTRSNRQRCGEGLGEGKSCGLLCPAPTARQRRPPTAIGRATCRDRSFRNAFTLLEVLLASALAATLLIGLWSLLNMQTRLFARAPARMEQCQLVRALYQQIADDLHTSIFIPADDPAKVTRFLEAGSPGGAAAAQGAAGTSALTSDGTTATVVASGTGRPSALIGTGQSLHLQVMQVPLPLPQPQTQTIAIEQPGRAAAGDTSPRVPELRDVSYTFHPPGVIGVDSLTYHAGLIRREITWDAADSQTGTASVPWIFRPESSDPATDTEDMGLGQTDPNSVPIAGTPRRDLVTYVPEVVGIEFRYFDGSSWSSGWDSHQRRALPVAVEVMVDFGNNRSVETSPAAAKIAAESGGPGPAGEAPAAIPEPSDLTLDQQPALNPNIYRFVIFLPSGSRPSGSTTASLGGGLAP
jgi:Tfp pilus assembly protein PilV